MSMEGILGLSGRMLNNHVMMAKKEDLDDDELDGDMKVMMPKTNDTITLPRVVDEHTKKDINMNFHKGTTTLSFIYKNGIVVCADSRATGGSIIASQSVKKIIPINRFLLGTMAGGAADCAYWLRVLSERCRLYELRNRQPISIAAASKLLSNMVYNYKSRGLSIGSMLCGFDHKKGPKIYYVDNDARRIAGNMFSVGSGSVFAYGVLDKGYRFDMEDEEAYDLGRRAIFHAGHRDLYSGGVARVYTVTKDGWKIISEDDISILYRKFAEEASFSINH